MSKERGKYLAVDGIDGSGKTTQVGLLSRRFTEAGLSVVDVVEPGSTPIGLELRQIILNPSIEKLPETETDLFMAARRETVSQVIRPSILGGNVVVSDRSWLSTVAMQGYGRGLDVEAIVDKAKAVMGEYFLPDGAVIIDVPVDLALERLHQSGKSDWFEKEGPEFFERVREGYHHLAERFNIHVIDGAQSIEKVNEALYEHLGEVAFGGH